MPRRPPLLAAAAAALALGPAAGRGAAAQSPVVTPAGDPSVRSDTVYRLAGKPSDHPDQSTLVLLDDGIVRLEPDGRGAQTYRSVVQILTQDAVERYQEFQFSWVPGRQRMRVNWLRVVRPDGTVVSAGPTQVQDSDVPAELRDPVYTDGRVRRLSVSGVAVGTIVDYSVTYEDLKPFPAGDALGSWSVSAGAPVRRSRLILDVPASLTPTIVERNLRFARAERVAGGRRLYTWAARDVPHVKPEPYAADSNDVYQRLTYALPRSWQQVGRWYAGLTKDRYALGPAARARIAEAVAGAASRDDSLRALHRWVAQDVRYVSVSLDRGGYVPRTPDEVVRTGFGDCKDKATLFVAALRAWGVAAHPVLLRTARVERGAPSARQFDHAIAAVEGAGGYRFVDLTALYTPWGELPHGPQGEFALVVRADGRVDEVTLPEAPVAANRHRIHLDGALAADGTFAGTYREAAAGLPQYAMRTLFETPLDSTKRADLLRAVAGGLYPGAIGDSLRTFAGRDLRATPEIALWLRGGKAAQATGGTLILALPVGSMEGMLTAAAQVEAQTPRRFPIDAEAVLGPLDRETRIRMTLPAGWKAELPAGVHAASAFGEFRSTYAQEGRDLVVTRRLVGARGVHPASAAADLAAWFRAVAKEDTRFIVLRPSA